MGTTIVAIHYERRRRGDALMGTVLEDKHDLTPSVLTHGLNLTPTTPVDHHVTALYSLRPHSKFHLSLPSSRRPSTHVGICC